MELWRDIAEFPAYAVSDQGRIRRIGGKILKSNMSGRYAMVSLYRDRNQFQVCIHRIVCITFHGKPPSNKHHAAHRDGDSENNRANNLRWATPKENEADKILHGTSRLGKPSAVPPERRPRGHTHGRYTMPESTARGERGGLAKLTKKKVIAIRKNTWPRRRIAEKYGITVTMVGYIQRGISWAHIPMEQL